MSLDKDINTISALIPGGGEMGNLIREHNWKDTTLGSIEEWPVSLVTTLSIMLNSGFPYFLFWGKELIFFYNDAFRPIFGVEGKHPAIGKKANEVWSEIWDFMGPLLKKVKSTGKPVWFEDQYIPFFRNGRKEDIYWTFSCSPAFDYLGEIQGVLVICMETTQKVLNKKQLEESINQLEFAVEATQLGTWDFNLKTNRFIGNNRLNEWLGLEPDEEIDVAHAFRTIAETDRDKVNQAFRNALDYASGGDYQIEYTIIHPVTNRERIVSSKGRVWFNKEKKPYRFNGTLQDITESKNAETVLKKSNEWYQLVNKATQDAIWDWDLITDHISWNEVMYTMFNYNPENVKADAAWWSACIHPEDKQTTEAGIKQAIASGEDHWSAEYRFLKGNNEYAYVYDRGFVIHDELGKPVRMIGSMQDITHRKNAEAEQQKQIALIENSHDFIGMSDLEGKVQFLNKAGQQLVGLHSVDEVRETIIYDYFMPEEKEYIKNHVIPIVMKEGNWSGETKFRHFQSGEAIPMSWNAFVIKDPGTDKPIGLGFLSQNLTERIKTEQVIKESEARFRNIADASPAFIWTLDSNMKLNYLNKAARDYYKIDADQLEELDWLSFTHPDESENIVKIMAHAIKTKSPYEVEQRLKKHDGTYNWFLSIGKPALLPGGELYLYVGTSVDITEQKLSKEDLEFKNAQLIRINNDLDNFIYTASHDLKAPMTNIEGLLHELHGTLEPEKLNHHTHKLLQMMEKSISRFKTTILDLTEITKAQKDQEGELTEIDFEDVIEDVKTSIYDKIKISGAIIEYDFSKAPSINFLKKSLHSILYNLISNAIKYKDELRTPKVFIQTQKVNDFVVLTIQDNGLGIADKNLSKMFSMFKRFHDHVEGTGIGLYIVKRIIENAGGKIEVESRAGEGTLFKVYFKQ